ncbi:unnamed protein product, partial [Prorocentrum cordatum]
AAPREGGRRARARAPAPMAAAALARHRPQAAAEGSAAAARGEDDASDAASEELRDSLLRSRLELDAAWHALCGWREHNSIPGPCCSRSCPWCARSCPRSRRRAPPRSRAGRRGRAPPPARPTAAAPASLAGLPAGDAPCGAGRAGLRGAVEPGGSSVKPRGRRARDRGRPPAPGEGATSEGSLPLEPAAGQDSMRRAPQMEKGHPVASKSQRRARRRLLLATSRQVASDFGSPPVSPFDVAWVERQLQGPASEKWEAKIEADIASYGAGTRRARKGRRSWSPTARSGGRRWSPTPSATAPRPGRARGGGGAKLEPDLAAQEFPGALSETREK